jgi:ABC-type multidrug transport system fused ATPase/permease subunit
MISVGRVRGLFDPVVDALPSLGTLAVLLVGALRLRAGAIDLGDVVSVSFLFTVLGFPVQAIGYLLAEMPRSAAGWARVARVLDATGEMDYGTSGRRGTGPAALRFDGVSYGYEGGPTVLHDVTFEVAPGRTVALVGPTGSGKSTIASLAVRLVDPASGIVTLDGRDLREHTAGALAAATALVPQVPFVFDDTVRGNVTLDRSGIDDAEVWSALRLAQADGFVAALPDSLGTHVGERGATLSGGQRQRLTLARALAGGPGVLVLDDATSAVDPRVEAAILDSLRSSGGTVLVVAYRRATIALADEVVYVEQGRVVARGTHPELLATVPGYAALVTAYDQVTA